MNSPCIKRSVFLFAFAAFAVWAAGIFSPVDSYGSFPRAGACQNVGPDNGNDDEGDKTPEPVVLSNGNFIVSYRDVSVPGLGPSIDLTRTYHAQQTSRVPGWRAEAGSWSVQDNTLMGKGDRMVTETYYADTVFEVDLKTELAGEQDFHVGWVNFRYSNILNFYYFMIRRNGVLEATKVKDGITTQILFTASTLDPFDWHTVRVEFVGNVLKIFVDGDQKVNYVDPDPLPTGRIGLNSYFSQVRYDNVVLYPPASVTYDFNWPGKAEETMFGYGWMSTYERHVEEQPDGSVIVYNADGSRKRYGKTGSVYVRPKLVYEDLTKDANGFDIRDKYGTVWHFDLTGALESITDRNGNALTLTYTSGQLAAVTDAVGRSVQFSYGPNGKVDIVTDPLLRETQYVYNAHNDLTEVIAPGGRHVQMGYDDRHQMITRTDRENNLFRYEYYYNERVSLQIDPLLRETTFFYFWDYTDITNDRGETYHYTFINDYLTESVTDPDGEVVRYDYDADFNRNQIIDKNGNVTDLMYDGNGNVTSVTRYLADGAPVSRSMTYDLTWNRLAQIIDEENRVTDITYDSANGNMLTVTHYIGGEPRTVVYDYNALGQRIRRTAENDTFIEYEYDTWGNRRLVREPLGKETEFTFDAASRLRFITDANEHVIEFVYDDADNIVQVIYPDTTDIDMTYDKNKDLLTFANEMDELRQFEYDGLRNRVLSIDPLLRETSYTYDTANFMHIGSKLRTSVTDPNLHTTAFGYDAEDRLTSVTDPLTYETGYLRDPEGNLRTLRNARDFDHTFTYDSFNRTKSIADPLGNETTYTYDNVGNVKTRLDANGNLTVYTYDERDRLTSIEYPDSSTIAFTYDEVGNRLTMTDQTGLTAYIYNDLNRLTDVIFPNTDSISYTYDFVGNRLTMTSRLGTRVYTYDERNRLRTVDDPAHGFVEFTYDNAGRRKSLIYPNGITAGYTYNGRGDLTAITYENEVPETVFEITYTYDDGGNVRTMTDENGLTEYFYDDAGQLREVHYPGGEIVNYVYDPVGNRVTVTDASGTHTYLYDAADRLLSVDGTTYTYDDNGNQVSVNDPVDGVTSYGYDFENRLVRVSRDVIEYAAHLDAGWNFLALPGEPTDPDIQAVLASLAIGDDYDQLSRYNASTQSFEHYIGIDKFNQFDTFEYGKGYEIFVTNPEGVDLSVTDLAGPGNKLLGLGNQWNLIGSPGELTVPITDALSGLTFGTDYDRVSRWNSSLGSYEHYENDPATDDFTDLDPGKAYWLHALENTGWQIESTTQVFSRYTYNGIGERVAKYAQGNETHYLHDGSNVLYETDEANTVTTSYMHSVFIDDLISERRSGSTSYRLSDHLGSARKILDENRAVTDSVTYDAFGEADSIASSTSFLFTGRELDRETGLYHYRFRTYRPSTGRFTSKDPLLFIDGANVYRYVRSNPVNGSDPYGLLGEDVINEQLEQRFGDRLTSEQRRQIAEFTGRQIKLRHVPGLLKGSERALDDLEERVRKALENADQDTKDLFDELEKLDKEKPK